MATVSVYDMNGKEVSKKEISDSIFSIEPNIDAMHMVVVNHLARCRQGTQSTLTRTEVRGGGKKPWRQKGSGNARQGSIRSPQWVHGGVALGPKPRKYGFSINKKVRSLALKSALSSRFLDSSMVVVNEVVLNEYSTKRFIEILRALKIEDRVLVLSSKLDRKVIKSAANLKKVQMLYMDELNVYDILNNDRLILDLGSLERIEEVYA